MHSSQAAGLQQYLRAYRCMRSGYYDIIIINLHHRRPVRRQERDRDGSSGRAQMDRLWACSNRICCTASSVHVEKRDIGKISAIPPRQITAVQKSHCPHHPRGWHSEPSPSGRIAGVVCAGGIRMTSGLFWGRTHLAGHRPVRWMPSCWVGGWCMCPWFWVFGVQVGRPKTDRRVHATQPHPQG